MTEIAFHFNVADRTCFTCRLVRKACRSGANVVLAGPPDALAHFDRALWAFEDTEFLPHRLLGAGEAPADPADATRVWLAEDASLPAHHEVLVNLGPAAPAGFESFHKLIEIVSIDEAERLAARGRWKHYAARGYRITRHEAGQAEAAR